MRPVVLTVLGLAGVAMPSLSSVNAAPLPIQVTSPRVTLGMLIVDVPTDIAGVDLGVAPVAGKQRTITARQIRSRLRAGHLEAEGVQIPSAIVVERASQRLEASGLRQLIVDAVGRQWGVGVDSSQVQAEGALVLPAGEVTAEILSPKVPRPGPLVLSLRLVVGGESSWLSALVTLPSVPQALPAVTRGAEVMVIARRPGVVLQARGVVHADGVIGATVPLTVPESSKPLKGIVREINVVEVMP